MTRHITHIYASFHEPRWNISIDKIVCLTGKSKCLEPFHFISHFFLFFSLPSCSLDFVLNSICKTKCSTLILFIDFLQFHCNLYFNYFIKHFNVFDCLLSFLFHMIAFPFSFSFSRFHLSLWTTLVDFKQQHQHKNKQEKKKKTITFSCTPIFL